ncbi:MAG: hypothetical protein JW776_14270 [Candidatus Lokiarchaeota archaeon]|nr:hypothetical protein [Candidatus Lokiarchaeota archaeon]
MPIGIVLMRWDERIGAETLAKYPEELLVTDKTLMQVYSTHEYNQEAGMISLMAGASTIASYFSGPDHSLYVILVLTVDEDPDTFEDGLADVCRVVVQNMDGEAYRQILPSLFQRVSIYPKLDEEQRLMMLYFDETKRVLIQRLREEGSVARSEVAVWLKDLYKTGFIDIESVVSNFVKIGIVKQISVKQLAVETLFLSGDIMIYRQPVVTLLKNPNARGLPIELTEDYLTECKTLFESYNPTEEDNLVMVETLLDPQTYEAVKLMRQAIVTRDDLEKLQKKGVEDLEMVLKNLWDANFLSVMQDPAGNEYYALKSDICIKRIFPEYILNVIRQDYNDKVKNDMVLVEHLSILEDAYKVQ